MAIGFGATKGAGTTDRIAGPTEAVPSKFSFHIWTNRNGEGGGGLGRIFERSLGDFDLANNNATTAGTYMFGRFAAPFWRWTRPSAGVWAPIGVSVDTSSSANDPIVYQEGVKLTVGSGLTQSGVDTPYVVSSTQWHLGNRADGARNWDGSLAEPAWWDVILTDEEFYALQKGVSPDQIRPESLQHYFPWVRSGAINKVGTPGTVTGTAAQPHPAIILPHRRLARRTSASSAGVSGSLAYTNADDTLSASGTTTVTGSLSTTNANDTLAASGTVGSVTGSLAYTNADDTLVSSGTTAIVGTLAKTNADDSLAASGSTTVTGSSSTTNADDTLAASGAVGSSVNGSLAYTNADDTLSASGTTSIVGSSNAVNQNDTLAASGNTEIKGSLATINANDVLSASGIVGSVTGTLAYTNANDALVASGVVGDEDSKAGGDDYPLRVVHKARKKTLAEQPNKHLESIIAQAVREVFGEEKEAEPKILDVGITISEQKQEVAPKTPEIEGIKTLADAEKDAEKVGELLALYQQQVQQAQMQEDEDLLVLIMEMY